MRHLICPSYVEITSLFHLAVFHCISGLDCLTKDEVADTYGMCLPTMDGSQLKDVKAHILPSASNVKSVPSAKRSKYDVICAPSVRSKLNITRAAD